MRWPSRTPSAITVHWPSPITSQPSRFLPLNSGFESAAASEPANSVRKIRARNFLTPQPIVRTLFVPLRRRLEITRFEQMLLHHLVVQRDAQSRPVRHCNEALVDDRFLHAIHQIAPPGH